MIENILEIEIDAPIEKVFEFTIEPNNTNVWAPGVGEEIVDSRPIKIGTVYSNEFSKVVVSDFIENEVFELSEIGGQYIVRYAYTPNDGGTKLEYKEWMEDGSQLSEPFESSNLERLKQILEK